MKYLETFLFLLIPLLILVLSQNANALLVEKTDDQLYNENDVILIGKIIKAEGRFFERVTDYTISAEKYLKNDLGEQLQLSSNGKKDSNTWVEDEPIFDVGDRVLLYLVKNGNSYQISPYSHVLDQGEIDLEQIPPGDKILAPLKQLKSGIEPKDVVCKQGLELVMKKSNGQPICVKGTSVKTLTLRNYIPEYNGALGGEIPLGELFYKNQTNSIPLTLFSVTPQNVTLPDTAKQTQTFTDRISINKINQLKITNSDSTNGQKTHLAQLSINGVALHTKDIENLPAKPGFDTLVFDYTITSRDNDAFYAMLDFEVQVGSRKYPTLLNGGDFSEILLPDEKRDSYFAVQIGKGANQIFLNVKDPMPKKTLWVIPVDLTPFKIKYKTENGYLIQD